jgi:hypothetical protein
MVEVPRTAKPEEVQNAVLAVQAAQVTLDKARARCADPANAGSAGCALAGRADAAVKQALINLETMQNNLRRIQQAEPSEYDVRAQLRASSRRRPRWTGCATLPRRRYRRTRALDQAQATLDKVKSPASSTRSRAGSVEAGAGQPGPAAQPGSCRYRPPSRR